VALLRRVRLARVGDEAVLVLPHGPVRAIPSCARRRSTSPASRCCCAPPPPPAPQVLLARVPARPLAGAQGGVQGRAGGRRALSPPRRSPTSLHSLRKPELSNMSMDLISMITSPTHASCSPPCAKVASSYRARGERGKSSRERKE
jgi:hypothetical protein